MNFCRQVQQVYSSSNFYRIREHLPKCRQWFLLHLNFIGQFALLIYDTLLAEGINHFFEVSITHIIAFAEPVYSNHFFLVFRSIFLWYRIAVKDLIIHTIRVKSFKTITLLFLWFFHYLHHYLHQTFLTNVFTCNLIP